MIAFHFPPMRGSSGAQRTLNFCRYLNESGWQPRVLTVTPGAHPDISFDQMSDIPSTVTVRRAFAVDAARHVAIAGRYPRFLATPDRWASWWLSGVPVALYEIARWKPDLIWSTFPIATAHNIALTIRRFCHKPWVADLRDSMTEHDVPPDAETEGFRQVETRVVEHASRVVFTTPGTMKMYAGRYPQIPQNRWACIANGYAEEDFQAAERVRPRQLAAGAPLRLLHSGLLYPTKERDPSAFFAALSELRHSGRLSAKDVRIVLRASGHDAVLTRMIEAARIEDLVELQPAIPYREALTEMLEADGLLIFQSSYCNHQIPAKLYEYLRAGRPILAMTDSAGDTAAALRAAGVDSIAPLDSRERICDELESFLRAIRAGTAPRASPQYAAQFSRRAQAGQLAKLFDELTHPSSPRVTS